MESLSYLDGHLQVMRLPDHLMPDDHYFDRLWSLHPLKKSKVFVYGKYHDTSRYIQTYLRNYNFSKTDHPSSNEVPDEILPYFNAIHGLTDYMGIARTNGILVNWYENGNHYIRAHGDDVSDLVENIPIFTISLGQTRTFRIRDKKTKKKILDLPLHHGYVVIMSYEMQLKYTHEIPK